MIYVLIFLTFNHIQGSDLISHESWKHPANFNSFWSCREARDAYMLQPGAFEAACILLTEKNTK